MKVEILDTPPEGYVPLKGATTAPKNTMWYWNKKSMFSKEFKAVLVKKASKNE